MNMNFENFRLKLSKISDTVTERSYYPLICEFIQNFRIGTTATPEESLAGENKNIGFPDITVRRQNGDQVGWWEIKLSEDSLNKDSFQIQFLKYKDALENVLFTNLREWQLWQWDQEGKPQKVAEIIFDIQNYATGEEERLNNLLLKFFEYSPYLARTPKQLALALAKKARFLSKQVEEAIDENDKDSDLTKLKQTFESTLIQDISTHQFSNMIAETLAYSLFLAFLEHVHRGKNEEVTLRTAIDYLPTNVPILADLYSLISKVSKTIPTIFQATQMLLDQLKFSDMEKIYYKLVEHKPGEDPVIQFYEPFLKEYDPKEREARGVYYTPKPVVDFIIRSVDQILREKFGKEKGLADESVHLLDPATGTGTFLMSAIQQIYENVKKENINQGEEMVQKSFNKIVIGHILKHFYGFELMVAPYAIAHLKLTMLLETLGFNFEMTKDDGDPDNDRLKIYLANTLDDPEKPSNQGKATNNFGEIAFPAIPDESEMARKIKKEVPILVISGNPPYSGHSANKSRDEYGKLNFIGNLIEDYKKEVPELNKPAQAKWLQDDYVKFIRFAQWKIEENKEGVIGFITNNSYLDNPTFRGMRQDILNSFDQIYILNLHGSTKKKEVSPGGEKDENIFNIQQGVAIVFFIKNREVADRKVYYSELWGSRLKKFEYLANNYFYNFIWKVLSPLNPSYLFIPENIEMKMEYESFWKINDIFSNNGDAAPGIVTTQDDFAIAFSRDEIIFKVKKLISTTREMQARQEFKLCTQEQWNYQTAKTELSKTDWQHDATKILYRPFDIRWTIYSKYVAVHRRERVMNNFLSNKNLALITSRQKSQESQTWSLVHVSNQIIESSAISNKTKEINYLFPLYIYSNNKNLFQEDEGQTNINEKFLNELGSRLSIEFVTNSLNKSGNTFNSEEVFYYAYAIFHSPTYRVRYAEQLKIDFPRLPLTSSKELFKNLVIKGNELVNLHLLGENPFDKSKTIFDEPEKWNVKIGGTKPESLEDWKVTEVRYEEKDKRVYVNPGQYFEGIEKKVWDFMIGGYQVCEKWLKDRKKAERKLDTDDLKHYMKIVVSLRETFRIMKEIDEAIPEWPLT